MKYAAILIAGLALAGCDNSLAGVPVLGTPAPTFGDVLPATNLALPIGVKPSDINSFRSAVSSAGCANSTADIQAQTGFDAEKLRLVTQHLIETGEVVSTTNGYQLTSGQCANA